MEPRMPRAESLLQAMRAGDKIVSRKLAVEFDNEFLKNFGNLLKFLTILFLNFCLWNNWPFLSHLKSKP